MTTKVVEQIKRIDIVLALAIDELSGKEDHTYCLDILSQLQTANTALQEKVTEHNKRKAVAFVKEFEKKRGHMTEQELVAWLSK